VQWRFLSFFDLLTILLSVLNVNYLVCLFPLVVYSLADRFGGFFLSIYKYSLWLATSIIFFPPPIFSPSSFSYFTSESDCG
jgi:hypothetical protein